MITTPRPTRQVVPGPTCQVVRGYTHDLAPTYRRFGHDVRLNRHLIDVDEVAAHLRSAGLHETCRLVRAGQGNEEDPQAMLLAQAAPHLKMGH